VKNQCHFKREVVRNHFLHLLGKLFERSQQKAIFATASTVCTLGARLTIAEAGLLRKMRAGNGLLTGGDCFLKQFRHSR
jgi:hypothetical protein